MTTKSVEKWPTPFQIEKISDSVMGKEFIFFFVTGVLTQDQYRILSADLNLISVLEIEGDKRVVSTLVDQEQLEELHKVYEPRSRSWRGQYQVLSKAIVTEYEKVLKV
jgi:hypothetical protein